MNDVQRPHPEYFAGKNWYPQEDYDARTRELYALTGLFNYLIEHEVGSDTGHYVFPEGTDVEVKCSPSRATLERQLAEAQQRYDVAVGERRATQAALEEAQQRL